MVKLPSNCLGCPVNFPIIQFYVTGAFLFLTYHSCHSFWSQLTDSYKKYIPYQLRRNNPLFLVIFLHQAPGLCLDRPKAFRHAIHVQVFRVFRTRRVRPCADPESAARGFAQRTANGWYVPQDGLGFIVISYIHNDIYIYIKIYYIHIISVIDFHAFPSISMVNHDLSM